MKTSKLICICGSAGSIKSIEYLLRRLPSNFPIPIVILVHTSEHRNCRTIDIYSKFTTLTVISPDDLERIQPGHIYIAPPMYHIQIEKDYTFSFTAEAPVNFSRPSADILLETAATAYENALTAIILSGASQDGATGAKQVENMGGTVLVIDPKTAESDTMPKSALKVLDQQNVMNIESICKYLIELGGSVHE